jgi:hypothetical protein
MKWLIETVVWLLITGVGASLLWGPSLPVLSSALLISLLLSLLGGNLIYWRKSDK